MCSVGADRPGPNNKVLDKVLDEATTSDKLTMSFCEASRPRRSGGGYAPQMINSVRAPAGFVGIIMSWAKIVLVDTSCQ